MKVLFICHFFPPTHTSGAENYTFNLAQALVQRGHQVYVLCAGTWDSGELYWNGHTDETYAGIQVRRLQLCWHKAPDPNRYLYDNSVTAEHLRNWLPQVRPDVIHITSCYTLSSSVIQICKEASIPVVLTLVDFWFLCPSLHLVRGNGALCDGHTTPWECLSCLLAGAKSYRWPAKLLPDRVTKRMLTAASERSAVNRMRGLRGMALNMTERKQIVADHLRQTDVILAPSRFLAAMHEAVIDDLDIRVQPHGHNLDWLSSLLGRVGGSTIQFCYLGQIHHDKGVHVLVEAFKSLDPSSDAELNIWGSLDDSPYVEQIQSNVAESTNIHLRGRFPRTQLAEVLAYADVVVVPSIWYENNPLVIQEAFAAQVPVITTNLGGMAEFVLHEVNGLLFERGNVDDLARQMQRMIAEPELLERLRNEISPVKSIDQEVAELLVIYKRCSERGSFRNSQEGLA